MNGTLNVYKSLVIFGVPISIIVLLVLLAKSSIFEAHPAPLSAGIIIDLLFTVPLIYFLLIRKTNIPRLTVLPFLIAGIVVCSLIIPSQNQYYLDLFKAWVLPLLELAVVFYVIYHLRKAIRRYRLHKKGSVDFYTALKATCDEILPRGVVMPVVTEISVFYYGFISWKKRQINKDEYTYHKDSGTVSLLIAILLIVAIETVVLHILLAKWNLVAAWILTSLSIYSGLQLFGFLKSMYQRPIAIEKDALLLRYGMMCETSIKMDLIESIELSSGDQEWDRETRKLSFLGSLESHNVLIRLKEENELVRPYGITRTYKNLAFYVDDKAEFVNRVIRAVNRSSEL
ncbi:hypothetical protein [Muriicola marianensis]|uniref:Beta-carotene 15,15'-monooxygenase n=1 Tax=Muriicola marianensis TaxID=1324801 RepID=A0ABQ1R0A8_9FLAO|nr:hypothetical protein [Muriicola marianensis]GGD53507.1 hypothetical protein GCM10011361_20250 [Muriicola marianensis]